MDATAVIDEIPLARDSQGAYRVGGTRVTLDLVIRAFNRGATAEEIVQKYDTLHLADECFDNHIVRGLLRRSPGFDPDLLCGLKFGTMRG
jgi:Protein of unknown function (DUF433)